LGIERMKESIDWALLSGISNIKSIITAAKKGKVLGEDKKRLSTTEELEREWKGIQ